MVDPVSIISLTQGLLGFTAKDAIVFARNKIRGSESAYRDFQQGIKKTINAACKRYVEYCKSTHERLRFDFIDAVKKEIAESVLKCIDTGAPFTMIQLLPREDLPDPERKILYHFLIASLNKSLEYCQRDFAAWSRGTETKLTYALKDISEAIHRLEDLSSELYKAIEALNKTWPVKPITIEWYLQRRREALAKSKEYIKEYYSVTDNFNVMSGAICADLDCPNQEAMQAAKELIDSGKHLLIVGEGGEGKSSLLLRLAVEYALEGRICYWLRLEDNSMTVADVNQGADMLNLLNRQAIELNAVTMLFIDNPYVGQKMLDIICKSWCQEYNIEIICAERINNMKRIYLPNDNHLKVWTNRLHFLYLYSRKKLDNIDWMQAYTLFQIKIEWKLKAIKKMMISNEDYDEHVMSIALSNVMYRIGDEQLSLVEIMFTIFMQYNHQIEGSKIDCTKQIKLAWDEWELLIHEEFPNIAQNTFCYIATLCRINCLVKASEFCDYYEIKYNLFKDFLIRRISDQIDTPINLVVENEVFIILPKHDMISELYFYFSHQANLFDQFISNVISQLCDGANKAYIIVNLVNWYYHNFQGRKVIPNITSYLAEFENTYGAISKETAVFIYRVAEIYIDCGDYDLALTWSFKALSIEELVIESDHLDKAMINDMIARIYMYKSEYKEALLWFKKALKIQVNLLGEMNIITATTINNIALNYMYDGDYKDSLMWHKKALTIREQLLGKMHLHTAITYNNIAVVYTNIGLYDLALEWNYKALSIREMQLGTMHPDIAFTYDNIAGNLLYKGEYENARELFNKALIIREQIYGSLHPETATTYHNLGAVNKEMGNYEIALEWYKKSLLFKENILGKFHVDTIKTYINISDLYEYKIDHEKTIEWLFKGYFSLFVRLGENHPLTKDVMVKLHARYLSAGKKMEFHKWLVEQMIKESQVLTEPFNHINNGFSGNDAK